MAIFASVASRVVDMSPPTCGWLPRMDSNHDKQIQNLQCYRYTTRQMTGHISPERRCLQYPMW